MLQVYPNTSDLEMLSELVSASEPTKDILQKVGILYISCLYRPLITLNRQRECARNQSDEPWYDLY